MTYHTQYRYYKRSEEPEGRAQVSLQEEQECTFTLEYWGQGQWLDGRAWWWRIRQEDDFWEIPGDAAFSEISRMSDCDGTETKHWRRSESPQPLVGQRRGISPVTRLGVFGYGLCRRAHHETKSVFSQIHFWIRGPSHSRQIPSAMVDNRHHLIQLPNSPQADPVRRSSFPLMNKCFAFNFDKVWG